MAMLKPSVEYNRKAVIIEGLHWALSNRNNSVFWIPEIIRLWRCGKINGFRTVQWVCQRQYASEEECTARTRPTVVERAQAVILDDPEQLLRKLASIVGVSEPTMRRIVEEELQYKSYTLSYKDTIDALWGCQDKPSCSPRLPFWLSNSLDLNLLDYYVWSVVERVTNKSRHPNVTSLRTAIETAFVGMDSYIIVCVCECFENRSRRSS